MPNPPNTAELQRLRYWQGQLLRSRDFQDGDAIAAQLRWWHNRALHNTFGIVHPNPFGTEPGMKVKPNLDLKSITVHPGLAYDCFGRELIHLQAQAIPIPPAKKGIILMARYKDTHLFARKGELAEACLPEQVVSTEEPEFFWQPSDRVGIRDGVPLARFRCVDVSSQAEQECHEDEIPTIDEKFIPPISRPLARPRIATGATIPGKTAWEVWNQEIDNQPPFPLGFQVKIDTSATGFTKTPCYFAWLQGSFWHPKEKISAIAGDRNFRHRFILAPLEHIDEASCTGFTFRVWMPELRILGFERKTAKDFETRFLNLARTQELFVCWLGIQSDEDDIHQQGVEHGNP